MATNDTVIADVIRAAGGELIGRIRLQKILYLLDVKGLGVENASFHYHHYGPYSRVLDEALDRAKALWGVKEEIHFRKTDGASFSVFRVDKTDSSAKKIGKLDYAEAECLIRDLKTQTPTILELAATIHWLAECENVTDWKTEIIRRKGPKTEEGRLEKAEALLKQLGIQIAA